VADTLARRAGRPEVAVVYLAADALRAWSAARGRTARAPRASSGRCAAPTCLAVAGVGDPAAFASQLAAAGAAVELARFRDHHAYTPADAAALAARAAGVARVRG
jgi:tetraacyldisaccharide 4'-kinase